MNSDLIRIKSGINKWLSGIFKYTQNTTLKKNILDDGH